MAKNFNLSKLVNTNKKYFGINKSELKILGKMFCYITFENREYYLCLIVVDDFSMGIEAILGRDFLNIVKLRYIWEISLKQLYKEKTSSNTIKDDDPKTD